MKNVTVAVNVMKHRACESAVWRNTIHTGHLFTAGQGDNEQKFRERDQSDGQL